MSIYKIYKMSDKNDWCVLTQSSSTLLSFGIETTIPVFNCANEKLLFAVKCNIIL